MGRSVGMGKAGTAGAAVALALLTPAGPGLAQIGDPDAGARVFSECAACHLTEPGSPRPGPHLAGIVGRPAGTVDGFRYSPAMQQADFAWTEDLLAAYVVDPRGMVPGTTMVVGLRDAADAPDLIAYLRTLGGPVAPHGDAAAGRAGGD